MKRFCTAVWAALLVLGIPVFALGNSAEPPSLTILVHGGPADLEVSVRVTDTESGQVRETQLELTERPWTRYYLWYDTLTPWVLENWYHMGPEVDVDLVVQGGGGRLVLPLDAPTEHTGYSRLLTLDLEKGVLLEGEQPFWWVPLKILLRVASTLLLEGAVFWLFGYRAGKSWAAFLVINLITQAFLNAMLMGSQLDAHMALVLLVLFIEPVVFIGELILLCVSVKEKKKWFTAICSVAANLLSLVPGSVMIGLFPV